MMSAKIYCRSAKVLLAISICLCLRHATRADSVTVNMSSVPLTTTDWTDSMSFPLFDRSLGTLTAVDFNLNSNTQVNIAVQNNGTKISKGAVSTALAVTLNDGSVSWLDQFQFIDASTGNFNVSALNAGKGLAAGGGATSNLASSLSGEVVVSDASELAHFVGTGSIALPFQTSSYDQASLTGTNVQVSFTTLADLSGSVTYDYSPSYLSSDAQSSAAPLPGVVPTFGAMLAIGSVGVIRSRRMRH